MHIDWWTLALQAINFLVLVWLLSRFLYRPVQRVIAERRALAEAALKAAEEREAAAEEARRKYEEALAQFEAERRKRRAAFEEELEAERQKLLAEAEAEAEAIRAAARRRGEAERSRALDEARGDIAALAAALAERILAAAGTACAADEPRVQIAAARMALEEMDPAERAALAAGRERVEVRVITAHPLDAAGRRAWEEALAAMLGGGVETRFEADPALLGGVVLAFPGAELRLAWSDFLAEARARLIGSAAAGGAGDDA